MGVMFQNKKCFYGSQCTMRLNSTQLKFIELNLPTDPTCGRHTNMIVLCTLSFVNLHKYISVAY